jgi:hypothetical protein
MVQPVTGHQKVVDVRPLKMLAVERFPSGSILRRVLAAEPDVIPACDYVAKLSTWLAILREDGED